jgi:hypothetical protein
MSLARMMLATGLEETPTLSRVRGSKIRDYDVVIVGYH